MPSKNNKKKNAFYFFMIDWKESKEKQGHKFLGGLRSVQDACDNDWKNISETAKEHYKNMAKKFNSNLPKKTSAGELLEVVKEAEEKQRRFMDDMKEYITSIVSKAIKNKDLTNLTFYIIHVNYYYYKHLSDNQVEYYPAEIGIAECSLKDGVKRIFHKILKPVILTGYASEAMIYSNSTHNLPVHESLDFAINFNGNLYDEVVEFLDRGRVNKKLPPLYTRYQDEYLPPVLNVMNKLADFGYENFTIYSLEELLVNLSNNELVNSLAMDTTVAAMELKKDPFDYKKSTECEFHQTIRSGKFCSMSIVMRWMFVICDICCSFFDITPIPGQHIPKENACPNDPMSDLSNEMGSMMIEVRRNSNRNNCSSGTGAIRKTTTANPEQTRGPEEPLFIIHHDGDVRQQETGEMSDGAFGGTIISYSSYSSPNITDESSYDNNFPSLNVGRGARRNNTQRRGNGSCNYASTLKTKKL